MLAISNQDHSFGCGFAVMNKSYAKDLSWSIVLYKSYEKFSVHNDPYYVVVPKTDLDLFYKAFEKQRISSDIVACPTILAEEDVIDAAGILIPPSFGGWHVQQIIKLCFSKMRIAKTYLAVDSRIVFSKNFDRKLLFDRDQICTSAQHTLKYNFFNYLQSVGEKGWLNGEIHNISSSFETICSVMGNNTASTNSYISCTGLFDSQIAIELENFARAKNINGFVGLIEIAPYEFAWYGEYVYSQASERFRPHNPHLFTLVISPEDSSRLSNNNMNSEVHHFGFMFQPPASDITQPDDILRNILDGHIR